jgi:hypothetical protein
LFSFANEHGISVPVNVSFRTNKGGKRVRTSDYKLWNIDDDGLISELKGHFDNAEHGMPAKHGVDG